MARVLIVGCGCRGTALGSGLVAAGHAVRGTSRAHAGTERIAAAGLEPARADPDRIGTLMPALEGVTVLCWLLGRPAGDGRAVAALHSGRLRMLLERLVDTPVRGLLYEPLAPGAAHAAGAREEGLKAIAHARETWALPVAAVEAGTDPGWPARARAAVEGLLTPPARGR